MGTGSKTTHQAYDLGPTAEADTKQVPAEPVPPSQPPTGEFSGDLATLYAGFVQAASDDQDPQEQHKQYLAQFAQLTPEQLQQLASEQGFAHPQLVGLSGGQPHPLVHWLDPFYPQDIASKQKIQEVASSRYTALLAGQSVGGLTLADLPGPHEPKGPAQWTATLSDVVSLQAQVAQTLANMPKGTNWIKTPGDEEKISQGLAKLVALENQLSCAKCPDDPAALAQAQAAVTQSINSALANSYPNPGSLTHLRQDAVASGMLTSDQEQVLGAKHLLAVARISTPEGERDHILQMATERAGEIQSLNSLAASHQALVGQPFEVGKHEHWDAVGTMGLAGFASLTGQLFKTKDSISTWVGQTPLGPTMAGQGLLGSVQVEGMPVLASHVSHSELMTKKFRSWAKGQPLTQLRQVAGELGLEHADVATRAQTQNWIASKWDPKQDPAGIQLSVAAKAATPVKKDAPAAAPTSAPKISPTTGGPAPGVGGTPVVVSPGAAPGWASQHADLVAALKHAAASSQALPARLEGKVVSSWDFGAGTSGGHLGGTHSKSLHTGPDGGTWMFKKDSSGGARASAESDASAAFAAAGLPAVPVYRAKVAGKSGSVQPMVANATPFPGKPSEWNQADVDAIMRYHTAAWVVGNHDGHPENLLRVANGGMVAIDLGQAFKFCHQDRLSLSYSPAAVTVSDRLYKAHLGGTLPAGLKINPAVIHPVISAFEKIPDSQWRAILHDTAHTGARGSADRVPWVPAMRKKAAQKHGIAEASVSHNQIAEAFLDAAVDRKAKLRTSFANFYTKELNIAFPMIPGGN